jgi:hypothetical protein
MDRKGRGVPLPCSRSAKVSRITSFDLSYLVWGRAVEQYSENRDRQNCAATKLVSIPGYVHHEYIKRSLAILESVFYLIPN